MVNRSLPHPAVLTIGIGSVVVMAAATAVAFFSSAGRSGPGSLPAPAPVVPAPLLGGRLGGPEEVGVLSMDATVVRVVDGDTLDVDVSGVLPGGRPVRVRVRLLDCWAPERGDPEGPGATAALESLCPVGDAVTLRVPMLAVPGSPPDLARSLTFGRVLARVLHPSAGDVSAAMVSRGLATETRR